MTKDEPLTWADLTDQEREFLRTIRLIPRHRWPVLSQMMDWIIAGTTTEDAGACGWLKIIEADAEHAAGGAS